MIFGRPDRHEALGPTAEGEPLRLAYDWQQPLFWSALPMLFVAIYALSTGHETAWFAAFTIFLVWLMYAFIIWLRTRAYFRIDDDDVLHVRRFFGTRTIRGEDVVKVKEVVNGRSPDVKLVLKDARNVVVPSSRLHGGHSVLFVWLFQHNPDVELDKGAVRIVNALEERGAL